MEIEKKFLVSDIPDLSQAVKVFEIEQGYLCSEPTVRIRRKNNDYILLYIFLLLHSLETTLHHPHSLSQPLQRPPSLYQQDVPHKFH